MACASVRASAWPVTSSSRRSTPSETVASLVKSASSASMRFFSARKRVTFWLTSSSRRLTRASCPSISATSARRPSSLERSAFIDSMLAARLSLSSSERSKSLVWARKAFCCLSISATACATRDASDSTLPKVCARIASSFMPRSCTASLYSRSLSSPSAWASRRFFSSSAERLSKPRVKPSRAWAMREERSVRSSAVRSARPASSRDMRSRSACDEAE